MKLGKYGGGNTKFSKLTVKKVPLHFFNKIDYSKAGCGATALSLLTGVNPISTELKARNGNYTDSFMLKFLRKHKISAYEANRANLSNHKEWSVKIKDNHVVMFSCLTAKNEGSWFVSYNNVWFHNFEVVRADTLALLSMPITSMYVLYKKEWTK